MRPIRQGFLSFWLMAALLILSRPSLAGVAAEVANFGSNPGQLKMFRYIPDRLRQPAPLVVVLHGCAQTAVPFAQAAGWMQVADRWGFALLLPEQQSANNHGRCFNWFRPEDASRDQGEALPIRQMIARMQADYTLDLQKIYVTGVSAGGAMTAALLAVYPDLFAGGASIAGIPYGCAQGWLSGLWCMQFGRDFPPERWAEAVRRAGAAIRPAMTRWPRLSIWQGEADWVVDPANAQELLEQWTTVSGLELIPGNEEMANGYRHRVYKTATGEGWVEIYRLPGMGHGVPIAFGAGEEGCGYPTDYTLPVGLCASAAISRFWGIDQP